MGDWDVIINQDTGGTEPAEPHGIIGPEIFHTTRPKDDGTITLYKIDDDGNWDSYAYYDYTPDNYWDIWEAIFDDEDFYDALASGAGGYSR